MIGEFLLDLFLRVFLELVLGSLAYGTGWLVLTLTTLGALPLAPLGSLGEKQAGEKRWRRWAVWQLRPGKRKALKAEWVCLAGVATWIGIAALLFALFRDSGAAF
jgi:hypothetical protein